jgi:hypothetical protein
VKTTAAAAAAAAAPGLQHCNWKCMFKWSSALCNPDVLLWGRIPVKVHPCTGTEALYRPTAHRGSRNIALLFHDHGTRRGWGVSVMPRPLFTPGKTRYPLYRRLGGPQGRYGHALKISPPPGFDPRIVQPLAGTYSCSNSFSFSFLYSNNLLESVKSKNSNLINFGNFKLFEEQRIRITFWLRLRGS